jgi:hypothetical protein
MWLYADFEGPVVSFFVGMPLVMAVLVVGFSGGFFVAKLLAKLSHK